MEITLLNFRMWFLYHLIVYLFLLITAPGITPTNIQHYEINTTSIFVKWNVSDNDQALGYIIYYNDEYIDVLDNTSVVLSTLSIEVEYSVSVRAYYDLLGPVSEATSVILHGQCSVMYCVYTYAYVLVLF